MDDHDDHASELTIRIQRLISTLLPSTTDGLNKSSAIHLTHLLEKLAVIEGAVSAILEHRDGNDNVCLLEQYAEQITDVKAELKDVRPVCLTLTWQLNSLSCVHRRKLSEPFF